MSKSCSYLWLKASKEASRRVFNKLCHPQISFPGKMLCKHWYQKLILALASLAVEEVPGSNEL